MLTIYCDTSIDAQNNICAWGCMIHYKNRQYTHSGHMFKKASPHYGELWAVIKALGKIKAFNVKKIMIYSDFQEIPRIGKKLVNPRTRKQTLKGLKGDVKNSYPLLVDYITKYQITLVKISRAGNPAHNIAFGELANARKEIL